MMATGTLQAFIESYTELELKMNGIERVKFYTEVETEKPYEKDAQAKLTDAASERDRGKLELQALERSYRAVVARVGGHIEGDGGGR